MNEQSKESTVFDYIVVGAGSAGCAFSGRLVNLLPNVRIALIEPGEDYLLNAGPKSDFRDPAKCPSLWNGVANKGYRTVPQKALNNRLLSISRASGVGGCSLVNAMIWRRGFREDWDEYMPGGWKGDDIEPEFQWLEEQIKPFQYDSNFIGERASEAAKVLGYGKTKDSFWSSPGTYNGLRLAINKEGLRQDMYRALGADNSRITLFQGEAEHLTFGYHPNGMPYASGVSIRMKDGVSKEILVKDKGEVIVSCGAIDTPKLLQLSGVGPAKLLKELDIPLIVDNPAVGEGLKDHVMHALGFEIPTLPDKLSPVAINSSLYDDSLDIEILVCDGNWAPSNVKSVICGPSHEKPPSTTAKEKFKDFLSSAGKTALANTLVALMEWNPSFRAKMQTSLSLLVNLMKPTSVGSVMINSKDPSDSPLIDSAFLKEEADMEKLLKGVTLARKLVKIAPLSDIVGKQLIPENNNGDDIEAELEDIRKSALSYHHSTGTCSIGDCLDDQLRFKGIKCLRVADASSLPFHPRVPTNASSMAVGAKCASIIANTSG